MPKTARQYDYSGSYTSYSGGLYPSGNIAHFHKRNNSIYNTPRIERQTAKRPRKKRSLAHYLVSCAAFLFMLFVIMPYGFNHVTKAIFVPTPYKNIQTDLHDVAFPMTNYLSNAWFMGQRSFRYAANEKQAQMEILKENVNMPVLKSELENLITLYPTIKPAVYVWDYETQNYVDINASEVFPTASIIKIPVLIDLFKSIEAGQVSLDDKMPLTEYFRTEGSGDLQFMARNSLWNIDNLARIMITNSDNSATNMIMAKIGSMTDVNQAIRDWGLKNTQVNAWLPDLNGNNHTTARDLATMLYNIDSNDKFLTEQSRMKMLNYMGHVHNDRLIQAGLGKDSIFLHKTGDIGSMLGDAGIVIAPNGKKYIVAILAKRPHNSAAAKDFIVHASEIIYNYMVK